ncbi:MAG: hypothetical protein R3E90_11340 [Marinicella sp.]|nr:hypothetical protein [Xanthomonadales bacterium]
MKKIISISLLFISTVILAELPSWGMTENQYKLPNFNTKMKEIGGEAAKNNWLLKITAPKDWHSKIRTGLTDAGAVDVQVNFKDSLHQSITITAAPGIKMAKVSPSTSNTTVQKQVVIDKPEIDTEVEAPEFGKIKIESNADELLESISNMEIAVPQAKEVVTNPTETIADEKSETKALNNTTSLPQQSNNEAVIAESDDALSEQAKIEESKENLRNRYARNKRVDKNLSYNNIKSKDDLYIDGSVVLIKRFVNQGVVLYFWMHENYDPDVHKLVDKGSGKYQKDPSAQMEAESNETETAIEENKVTNLDFIAIDTDLDSQDDLRRDFARNKRVNVNIRADQLREDDVLYVLNQTVLVERPITTVQSAYFWLVGSTVIPREVERQKDNQFIVR